MQRRSAVFLVVNLIISVLVAVGIIAFVQSRQAPDAPQQVVITVPILVTATIDTAQRTQTPFIITATNLPGTNVVALPTGLVELTALPRLPDGSPVAINTIDPAILEANPSVGGTVTALPANCIPYTLQSGDSPYGIALQYGADYAEILAVNGLTEDDATFLQIGQVLIVPLEGCDLAAQALIATQTATGLPTLTPSITPSLTITPGGPTQTPIPSSTFTPSNTPVPSNTSPPPPTGTDAPTNTPPPTRTPSPLPSATTQPTRTNTPAPTLPPTAANAQVVIVNVVGAGNLPGEGVEIRNNGSTTDLNGWTLRLSTGETYTFPAGNVFSGGSVTVNTRAGQDTPIARFWNQTRALLSPGVTVTLLNREGQAQSAFTVQ